MGHLGAMTAEEVGARIEARVAAELARCAEPEPEYAGHSVADLREALGRIQNRLSDPIDAWVRDRKLGVTLAAIRFYCGEAVIAKKTRGWARVIWTPETEVN